MSEIKIISNTPNITRLEYFAGLAMQGMLANSFSNGASHPLSEASAGEIALLAVCQARAIVALLDEEIGR